ncbi:maleylpyruvate isomerase N-terminal domain-containing protein [Streptomyces sp. RFCAC02]|uniref:maleylpyruvate isomerase N-terminal domain-containing protein n=1 Tax=Streptomyces sp. RFCAC02 TaxID=2499143 RepID=UPI00143DA241|nr:maleylpyruvate isomerase N-terminal domain-containing protein [Streptomyces sp. RFCAC02]
MNDTVACYGRALDGVGDVVARVPADRWRRPSPCPGWTGPHVIGYLIDGQRQVASLISGQGPRQPLADPAGAVTGDPAAAWAGTAVAVRELLTAVDPGVTVPAHQDGMTVERSLAMAAELGVPLDEEAVNVCLTAIEPVAGRFAATGMYAPAVPIAGHVTPQRRLLALLGRDAG